MKKYIFLLIATLLLACSKDSDPSINQTNIRMKINGVERTFNLSGYGINLMANGKHRLSIQMYTNDVSGVSEEYITISLIYKKKGNDIIDAFTCFANPNGNQANATGNSFHNKVTINNRKQFAAKVWGTMTNGTSTVEITDGIIEVVYNDPFGN